MPSPEDARRSMTGFALTYAQGVVGRRMNESAVENLLRARARELADIRELEEGYFEQGMEAFREYKQDFENAVGIVEPCKACGGDALRQYGLAAGGPGSYLVCLSEACDKITDIQRDKSHDD